jgi:glycosyltransferase involved in cell wall biosynthesis
VKNVITICGKVGWDRIDRVLSSEPDARWVVVAETALTAPRGLTDTFDVSLTPLAQYRTEMEPPGRSAGEEALDIATSMGGAEIAAGATLRLHLFWKWFSSWWIIEPALRDHLANLVESVRQVRTIVKKEKPDRIYVFGAARYRIFVPCVNLLHPEVVVAVGRQHQIDVVRVEPVARKRKISTRVVLPSLIRFLLWAGSRARRTVYGVSRWFKPVRQEGAPARTVVVVSDHLNWRPESERKTISPGKNDVALGRVLDRLNEDVSSRVLFADFLSFAGLGLRAIAEKLGRFARIDYRPLEAYVGKQELKDVWMHAHLFRSKWDEVKGSAALRAAASFEGVDLWEATSTTMTFFFLFWLPIAVYYTEAMASFIRREKPDVVMLVGDQGVYGRCFLAAAQALGVPTVGVQSRVISKDDRQYAHRAGAVPATGRFVGTTLCPIPDRTAVFGELTRNILIGAGGYPEDGVVVTGQPSDDLLNAMREDGARERICRRLNISAEATLVVLAIQTRTGLSHEHNVKLVRNGLEAIREFPEHRLLVKFYPGEEPPLRRRIAREKGLLDEIVLAKAVNLFDLLQACDLLITSCPTVALEAMLFGKPVVVIETPGAGEMMSYAEVGAAVCVTDAGQLVSVIRSVLTDEAVRRRLDEGRARFVAGHLHPRDGNAARRVVELALTMADEHARQAAGSIQGGTGSSQD